MAVLCRDHKLLFLQAPRTGSTAVGKVLRERLGGEWLPPKPILDQDGTMIVSKQHSSLKHLVDYGILKKEELAGLLIFSTVRNPYDSVVSGYIKNAKTWHAILDNPNAWIHRSKNRLRSMDYASKHSFSQWVRWHYGKAALHNFKERKKGSMYNQFVKRAGMLMRFENLQDDFLKVLESAGVKEKIEVPQYNVTKERKKHYSHYYDFLSKAIVYYRFKGDFERYGYRF